jgi:hypothetical protein
MSTNEIKIKAMVQKRLAGSSMLLQLLPQKYSALAFIFILKFNLFNKRNQYGMRLANWEFPSVLTCAAALLTETNTCYENLKFEV